MADNTEILSGLAEIVEEVAGIDTAEVTTEKSFVDDLDIDSLSMVEIAVQAEDKFGVKIPDDQLAELKTVADAVDYISSHQQGNRGRAAPIRSTVRKDEMSPQNTGVVVTGMGATTPLGGDVASTWEALLAGRSGVRRLDAEWVKEVPAQLVPPLGAHP